MAVANVTDLRGNGHQRMPAGFRDMPHDLVIEAKVLGILMVNNQAMTRVRDKLLPEHFYEPGHQAVYERTRKRIANGQLADVSTLSAGMDDQGRQDMLALEQACSGFLPQDIDQPVNELIELWQRRKQIEIAQTLVNASYDPDVSFDEWRRKAVEELQLVEQLGPTSQPLSYIAHDDISVDLPLRPFLVDKWVPCGCVTSLYGSGGTGKSFLALMLAMSVASGRPWLGFACEIATVLAVMCEDDEHEIKRRRNKIAKHMNLSNEHLGDRLYIVPRVGEPNAMMEFSQGVATRTPFFEQIIREAKRLAARLVILDNAAQLFAGNENDRSQVTAFLNACAGIARQIDGSVLLLGHPPKMQNIEFSGSTAWDAVVRSRAWFKRIETEDLDAPIDVTQRYSLELVKSNYTTRFGVELQENAHGVVEYVGELQKAPKGKTTNAERVFNVLRNLFEMHRRAITVDEIVEECIRRGIYNECDPGSAAWRDKRRKVRDNLTKHAPKLDERDDSYALRP